MNFTKHVVAALAMVLVTAPIARAGSVTPLLLLSQQAPQPTPEEAAVAALQKEFGAAMQEYHKPLMQARTAEERRAVKLDPAKNPAREYYPKFRALALEYGKTSAAFNAWAMTAQTAMIMGDPYAAEMAQGALLRGFANSAQFASYVPRLTVVPSAGETPEQLRARTEALLARVERMSKNPEVLAAVLGRRAALYREDAAKVAEINQQILAKYPDTTAGKRAKAAVYEAENLVVGKMAPDFESEDIDGKKFKLSDYRGKVVVMEFWGFW